MAKVETIRSIIPVTISSTGLRSCHRIPPTRSWWRSASMAPRAPAPNSRRTSRPVFRRWRRRHLRPISVDTLISIENVIGTAGSDIITGNEKSTSRRRGTTRGRRLWRRHPDRRPNRQLFATTTPSEQSHPLGLNNVRTMCSTGAAVTNARRRARQRHADRQRRHRYRELCQPRRGSMQIGGVVVTLWRRYR